MAKNIVASGQTTPVQLSYAIERTNRVYVYADGHVRSDLAYELQQLVDQHKGIIDKFDLSNLDLTKLPILW